MIGDCFIVRTGDKSTCINKSGQLLIPLKKYRDLQICENFLLVNDIKNTQGSKKVLILSDDTVGEES